VRAIRFAVEEADPYREDLVEAALAQIGVLERRHEELGPARLDVGRIAARGGLDHLGRTVDRREMPALEALADEGGRHSVPATALEDPTPAVDRAARRSPGAARSPLER